MAKNARHTPVLVGTKKKRSIWVDIGLLPHVGDALTKLAEETTWIEVGDPVEDILAACKEIVEDWYA